MYTENAFSKVIENVKRYTLNSLIESAIERILMYDYSMQTSIVLAYLEIVYREADNSKDKIQADKIVFSSICQNLFELMDIHRFSDFKVHNPAKMFHVLAYQQFPYQLKTIDSDISRQYFMFSADSSNSKLNSLFIRKYDISIKQYLDFCSGFIKANKTNVCDDTAMQILNIWTLEHNDIKRVIQSYSNGISKDFYKTFSPDFFIKYPIIKFNEMHVCIDPYLLMRTIREYLFCSVQEFPEAKTNFDKRFQQYVNNSLNDSNIDFKTDADLKISGKKECDFLISDFLFSECKAIKLKPLAQVNPDDTILKNNLHDIEIAYMQILSTANRFPNKEYEPFGIIITYLPFYFSDATDIWDSIGNSIENFVSENSLEFVIKPENLFFVDIRSWDLLIESLKVNGIQSLYEMFVKAKRNNSEGNRKMLFSMHFEES